MKISIVIPLYKTNKDKFKITLDNIKDLKCDLEVVFVSDGELNDDIKELIGECELKYIVYGKEHSGVSDTVNFGINGAKGDYIFLLNQHDSINQERIDKTVNMFLNDESLSIITNKSFHRSSCCIRKSILPMMSYWFEQYYAPCDIEKFVLTCRLHNIKHKFISDDFKQKRTKQYSGIRKRLKRLTNQIHASAKDNILTCIIPFKNEKFEVEKTINSILATTEKTSIIIINDASDDGYYYDDLQEIYPNIKYIKNKKCIGHGNIDLGVVNSETPCSILIDSHMRFYEDNWDERIVDYLNKNPKSIIYGNTTIIERNENGSYKNEDCSEKLVGTVGAGVKLDLTKNDLFRHFWAYNNTLEDKDENIHITPNVLGACYCFTNEWFSYIGGCYGLSQYGLSEACLALKTWLMGGKCYRIQDFLVGHVYRSQFPYEIKPYSSDLNRRFLQELCIVDKDLLLKYNNKHNQELSGFTDSFYFNWNTIEDKIKYYIKHYQSKFVMTIEEFDKNINSKFS